MEFPSSKKVKIQTRVKGIGQCPIVVTPNARMKIQVKNSSGFGDKKNVKP